MCRPCIGDVRGDENAANLNFNSRIGQLNIRNVGNGDAAADQTVKVGIHQGDYSQLPDLKYTKDELKEEELISLSYMLESSAIDVTNI